MRLNLYTKPLVCHSVNKYTKSQSHTLTLSHTHALTHSHTHTHKYTNTLWNSCQMMNWFLSWHARIYSCLVSQKMLFTILTSLTLEHWDTLPIGGRKTLSARLFSMNSTKLNTRARYPSAQLLQLSYFIIYKVQVIALPVCIHVFSFIFPSFAFRIEQWRVSPSGAEWCVCCTQRDDYLELEKRRVNVISHLDIAHSCALSIINMAILSKFEDITNTS